MQMGAQRVPIWFGIVQSPVVDELPGKTYICKCIWFIFPVERKIVPEDSEPDAIFRRGTEAKVTTLLSCKVPMNEQNELAKIPVVRRTVTQAETKSPLVVVMSKCGLMTIERTQWARPTQQTLPSRGILEFQRNVSFRMFVTNFSK